MEGGEILIRPICRNFVYDIGNTCFTPHDYLALLCGSSLVEDDPRDTDIFIYSKKDEGVFSQKLFYEFSRIDMRIKLTYLDALRFYSLKYNSDGIQYSIHIVSMETLFSLVKKASLVETYTDINVFDVKLYYQTVYRKWIQETEYLIGDVSLKEALIHELAEQAKPTKLAKQALVLRLKNNIAYFQEKVTDDKVICNVVLGQIFNNLINYCYLVNDTYYGTVKYIKGDLEGFKNESALCHLAIGLLESCNIKSIEEISHDVKRILNHIE